MQQGCRHQGVASAFLADCPSAGRLAFFHPEGSALPAAGGPNTSGHHGRPAGKHRAVSHIPGRARRDGATGKNWLFFGDQHEACDFLYRDEIESFLRAGVLDRLDLAASRDQASKGYVQSRMLTHTAGVFG